MKNQIQSWFVILDYWCNKKTPLGSGLTIPFLIGVINLADGKLINTSDFFKLLFDKKDEIFSIRKCNDIGEYIVQLNDKNDLPSLKYYNKFKNIYSTEKELLTENGEFQIKLEKIYSELIENKTFSKNNGNWNKLNDNDIKWIKNVLQHRI